MLNVIVAILAVSVAPALDTEVSLGTVQPIVDHLYAHPGEDVDLSINSPGGDVGVGLYLVQAITEHGRVRCRVRGLAASMAMVVLQACAVRTATPESVLMMHPVSTTVQGDARELREAADRIDVLTSSLLEFACKRQTWFSAGGCVSRGRATWWMGARDARRWGFVDEHRLSQLENLSPSARRSRACCPRQEMRIRLEPRYELLRLGRRPWSRRS